MKRTTYILIGLFISGLVLIVTVIVLIAIAGEKRVRGDISLEGERQTMNLEGVHVLKMFISQEGVPVTKRIITTGKMIITSPSGTEKNNVSYPQSKYVKIAQKEDTLLIELDMSQSNVPEKLQQEDFVFLNGLDIRLAADSLSAISTYAENMAVELKKMDMDSLLVSVFHQNVSLDSCKFRSFDISGYGLEFTAKDSEIEDFYLNLDGVRQWKFNNSKIDTEYLTGSRRHSNDLQKGECRRVVWTPMNKDASLAVTLREKAEIIVDSTYSSKE